MSKILFKTITSANRIVGCGKSCQCRSIHYLQVHNYLAVSRNVCEAALSVNVLGPSHIHIRRLNSSNAAIKTAVPVEKPDDTEPQIIKNVSESSSVKYKIAVNHENLLSSLNNCSSISEQIKEMHCQLNVSNEEKKTRLDLGKELEELLTPYFPNCCVILVGSSINGFGLKGCDIDLSFETGWDPSMQDRKLTGYDLPSLEDIDDGKVPVSKIQLFSPKQQLRFVRRVLTKYWNGCSGSRHLLSGRCPIIQFPYGPNHVSCDFSFGNSAAVVSTKLLLFCGKLDERVVSLSQIINYWAKRIDLIGSPDKFKSYAFALLLIHFLQTRKPSILPPLRDIIQKADFFRDDVLWDFDLTQDLSKFPKSENRETVEELLKEFFFFYLYFDFTRSICPLDGNTLSKSVASRETQPKALNHELASPICILDPFSATWNVTRIVSYKHCKIFIKELLAMCKMCTDPTIWIPSTENWGIAAIIDQRFSYNIQEEILTEFPITKYAISTYNRESINSWLIKVSTAVLKILNYALLFKCHVTQQGRILFQDSGSLSNVDLLALNFNNDRTSQICDPPINQKANDFPSAEHERIPINETLLSVRCTALNTWQGRCHWNEDQFPTEVAKDPLELEHAISLKLLENSNDREKQEFEFVFKCVESKENGERYLNFLLSPIEMCKFPTKGTMFLKRYVPSIVEKIYL